jgi:hypothetical protein
MAIVFNKHNFKCPQLLEKNPTKFRISIIIFASSGHFWRTGTKLPWCVCVVGEWHPLSLSHRGYPYNLVGQILKIFECPRLKSNSGRKKWKMLRSPTILAKEILISDWSNVRPSGTTSETPFRSGKTSLPPSLPPAVIPKFRPYWRAPLVNIPGLHHCLNCAKFKVILFPPLYRIC